MKSIKLVVLATLLLAHSLLASAKPYFYAHRGGRAYWPENTLYAFKQSLEHDVDFIDMDIQMSKEGIFVVTHNEALNPVLTRDSQGRWLNKKIPVAALTTHQLKQYNVGQIKPTTRYAKQFPLQQGQAYLSMPTLVEAIDFIKVNQHKATGFQIELKMPQQWLGNQQKARQYAKALYQVLSSKGIKEITEVQSFDFSVLVELRKLDKSVKLAFLMDENHQSSKWMAGHPFKSKAAAIQLVKQLGGTYWEPSADYVSASDIAFAHQQGLKVVVWGLSVDKKQEIAMAKQLIQAGVDGLISDRSDLKTAIFLSNQLG